MAVRTGGDSITLADIPTSVQVAFTYCNGLYAVSLDAVHARFSPTRYGLGRIDVTGDNANIAGIIDVETGDATPAKAALWVESWHVLHTGLPVIYCNGSTLDAVVTACSARGLVRGKHYGLWIATLSGKEYPHQGGDGIVACQWKGAKQTGGNWDESLIYNPNIWLPQAPAIVKPPAVTAAAADAALATLGTYVKERG
jgi:hypothetical protein